MAIFGMKSKKLAKFGNKFAKGGIVWFEKWRTVGVCCGDDDWFAATIGGGSNR